MLPVGTYQPPSQRAGGSGVPPPAPTGRRADKFPAPPARTGRGGIEEQGPSEYPQWYLTAEAGRFMPNVPPMVPAGLSGTLYGSYKQAEAATGYHIIRQAMLGSGGFGQVYKGFKKNPQRKTITNYAIKVINREIPGQLGGQSIKSLANEISYWEHCNGNPFVIRLVDHYSCMNQYHFVIEFSPIGNFVDEMKKCPNKRFTPAQARYYFKMMVHGINYLHARGIAHRDIKLDNFLLFPDPRDKTKKICKVSDFGLTIVAWTKSTGPVYGNNSCGTTRYMPPEILVQRKGRPMPLFHKLTSNPLITRGTPRVPPAGIPNTQQTWFRAVRMVQKQRDYLTSKTFGCNNDMWSLGVSLFVMVAGGYPFHTLDLLMGLDTICMGRFFKYKHMPISMRDFLRTMLEPDPAKRAKTKEIMYHDWMFDDRVTRGQRKSDDPDLSIVPPPSAPIPAPGMPALPPYQTPSAGHMPVLPPYQTPPPAYGGSGSPSPLPPPARARAGAIVQPSNPSSSSSPTPSPPSPVGQSPPASVGSSPSGQQTAANLTQVAEALGKLHGQDSSSSSDQDAAAAAASRVTSPRKVQFQMGGSSSPESASVPKPVSKSKSHERSGSREARVKFFAGGVSSDDEPEVKAPSPEKKDSAQSQGQGAPASPSSGPRVQFQVGGGSSSSSASGRRERTASREAKARFFAGAAGPSSEPEVRELRKVTSSEKKTESSKPMFYVESGSSSAGRAPSPQGAVGGLDEDDSGSSSEGRRKAGFFVGSSDDKSFKS